MAKILITGTAGFIGFHLAKKMLDENHIVIGLDNINDYYDTDLKYARLKQLGIEKEIIHYNHTVKSETYQNHSFIKLNLEDKDNLFALFEKQDFDLIINLAAQAGVRYSIENPDVYVQSNVVGFLNILEACRKFGVKKLLYASSSSVYGMNSKIPFSTSDQTDSPVSLYAATKKTNELMAHTYSHLYNITTIGLRFFTVYGPWGRPDMAPMLFADSILNYKPIKVFNSGLLSRDFTYIDDIVNGINSIIVKCDFNSITSEIFNIGRGKPVELLEFISVLETAFEKKAEKINYPMQSGDVEKTWADVSKLKELYQYEPTINLNVGIEKFAQWYKGFYNIC